LSLPVTTNAVEVAPARASRDRIAAVLATGLAVVRRRS
jgi:hypothetical protein